MKHEWPSLSQKPVRPLFWHSGQYLDPQHLQQTDIFHQRELTGLLEQIAPWFWGIDSMEVDTELLRNSRLSFNALGFRFPDGSRGWAAPRREDGNAVVETRDFSAAWARRQQPFTVYAGLCALARDRNVAGILSSENLERPAKGRFFAAENDELLPDRYGLPQQALAEDKAPARTLYYSVRLFWESELAEARADHHIFPLLRLHEVGAVIKVDESFCPPLLHINAWNKLLEDLRAARRRLTAVAARLQPSAPPSLFEGAVTPAFLLLRSLTGMIAAFDTAMRLPAPPPWSVFDILRRGLAEILPFLSRSGGKPRLSPAELPLYDHTDISACFTVLLEQYESIAREILPRITASCKFGAKGEFFEARLTDACLVPGLIPLLVVQSAEDMKTVLAQGRFILAAADELEGIARHALPGIPLRVLDSPPLGLPGRKDVHYLDVDVESRMWKNVIASRRLSAAFFPDKPCAPDILETRFKMLFLEK